MSALRDCLFSLSEVRFLQPQLEDAGYEGTHLTCTLSDYGLLCSNGDSPTFRRNISPPTPGSKSKVSKKPAEAGGKLFFCSIRHYLQNFLYANFRSGLVWLSAEAKLHQPDEAAYGIARSALLVGSRTTTPVVLSSPTVKMYVPPKGW
jgi:hypothetical protein